MDRFDSALTFDLKKACPKNDFHVPDMESLIVATTVMKQYLSWMDIEDTTR